jgi:hypothetical protein
MLIEHRVDVTDDVVIEAFAAKIFTRAVKVINGNQRKITRTPLLGAL